MPAKKKLEALPEPDDTVVITHGDLKVTVPRDGDDWPTQAELARIKAAGDPTLGNWLAFIELLLGDQWSTVTDTLTRRGDFYAFVREFNETVQQECKV